MKGCIRIAFMLLCCFFRHICVKFALTHPQPRSQPFLLAIIETYAHMQGRPGPTYHVRVERRQKRLNYCGRGSGTTETLPTQSNREHLHCFLTLPLFSLVQGYKTMVWKFSQSQQNLLVGSHDKLDQAFCWPNVAPALYQGRAAEGLGTRLPRVIQYVASKEP